jgi:cytochrome c oxidase cbb3-type subunit 1
MTVRPVNPRRLRPYDRPPRRRRTLIPGSPGSAAIGFLVVAVLWFGVAAGLGALAVALRVIPPVRLEIPLGLFGWAFTFDPPRVQLAFINATVYGWLTNAGFAAICFLTPRLVGRQLVAERWANVGLLLWNAALGGGITALYVFETGPNAPLTALPWWIEGGLATGALLVTASFVVTVAPAIRSAYISAWYAAVALLSLLGVVGAAAALSLVTELGFVSLPDVTIALGSLLLSRALEALWLVGIAVAVLYYVVPRATGNPLASSGLAVLGWLLWLVLAPGSALAPLIDVGVPYFVATMGAVATLLLLIPAFLVVMNLLLTMRGRWTLALGAGTAAFALVALVILLGTALLQGVGALRAVSSFVGRTEWQNGAFVIAALGAYSIAMLALAEHAGPRLLRRAWGGGVLAAAQLWAAFGGATIAGVALIGAGLAEGSFLAQAAPPDAIAAGLMPYRAIAAAGMGLIGLAALGALLDLFLLYTMAEPADHFTPVPGPEVVESPEAPPHAVASSPTPSAAGR